MDEIAGSMQACCAALQDAALACIIGIALLWRPTYSLRLITVARWSACVLIAALAIYLGVGASTMTDAEGAELPSAMWQVLTQSQFGLMIWVGGVASAMLALALGAPGVERAGTARKVLILIGILGFAFSRAATGHAINKGMFSVAVLNHTAHILAACTWLGVAAICAGLACYWDAWTRDDRIVLTQRVSAVATVSLIVVLITGVVNTLRTVGISNILMDSPYQSILALKLAGVISAAALGAYNRWFSMPRLRLNGDSIGRQFRRVLLVEVGALVLVLFAAAKLATMMPP
jgi:putative copper export protein